MLVGLASFLSSCRCSLTAHIAGIAGKNTLNGRIDKITGLDPNRVGFNINQSISRLAAGDARFVEVD